MEKFSLHSTIITYPLNFLSEKIWKKNFQAALHSAYSFFETRVYPGLFLILLFLILNETLNAQPLSASITSFTNVTCAGQYNGTATVTGSGGNPPYTYHWTNGQTTPTATNLWAGQHDVTLTDEDFSHAYAFVVIGAPPAIVLTPTITHISCFGESDGSISLAVSGGVSPYTYLWSNGETTNLINDLPAGNYTVTVTDNSNCTKTATYSVIQAANLFIQLVNLHHEMCAGLDDGSITIQVFGGVAPIIAEWSNGFTGLALSNLPPDTYTVTVTDNNDCTETASYEIEPGENIEITLFDLQPVSCFGGNNGALYVEASGGTTPYSYVWSNGATGTSNYNLTANTYTVTTTDQIGCTLTADYDITQPEDLLIEQLEIEDESCSGAQDGYITIDVQGGVDPISALWSNGQNGFSANNLDPGGYWVTVTDFNDCTETAYYTIDQGTTVIITLLQLQNVSCHGGTNGAISVEGVGGESPYTYLWSNGMTGSSIEGLSAGTYSVTTSDYNGCDDAYNYTVTEPLALSVSITQTSQNLCSGDSIADLSASVTGGNPGYTALWSNGTMGLNNNDLAAGLYTVTITDNNACTSVMSSSVTEPTLLTATVATTSETSSGANDGTATATPAGGTPSFTFLWSNGGTTSAITGLTPGTYTVTVTDMNGCSDSSIEQVFAFGCTMNVTSAMDNSFCEGFTYIITPIVTGASGNATFLWADGSTSESLEVSEGGEYCVTVTDASNCQDVECIPVTEIVIPPFTCPVTNESTPGANDGAIQCDSTPGIATFLWSNGATTPSISGLSPGEYCVTVTDSVGCSRTQCFTIQSGNCQLSVSAVVTNIDCHGNSNGSVSLTVIGAAVPVTYNWSNFTFGSMIDSLAAGNYDVTITDADNCVIKETFTIIDPPKLLIAVTHVTPANDAGDGSILVTTYGGTEPYTYQWLAPGGGTYQTEDLDSLTLPGYYSLTVTDAAGCLALVDSVFVDQEVSVLPTQALKILNVYPVPANDLLIIDTEKALREVIISGIDSRVHKKISVLSSNRIDVSDLGPGWYLVRVFDGKDWYIARMVK